MAFKSYQVLVGASLGLVIGVGALVSLREADELLARHWAYPVGMTGIGAAAGGAMTALSSLRRRNLFGTVLVWAVVMGAAFVAIGILDAVLNPTTDLQLLLPLATGAAAGIGGAFFEVYWGSIVED